MFLRIALCVAVLAGCSDRGQTPDPSRTTTQTAASGTACGPNGLVCNNHETCCVTDPLPPAPPRYICLKKGQACNP